MRRERWRESWRELAEMGERSEIQREEEKGLRVGNGEGV